MRNGHSNPSVILALKGRERIPGASWPARQTTLASFEFERLASVKTVMTEEESRHQSQIYIHAYTHQQTHTTHMNTHIPHTQM